MKSAYKIVVAYFWGVYSHKHTNVVDFYIFTYLLDLFFSLLDEDFHLFNTDYISRPVGFRSQLACAIDRVRIALSVNGEISRMLK